MLPLEQQHQRYVQQAGWTKPLRDYLFSKYRLKQSCRVLDVGCGTGALAPDLLSYYPRALVGVDIHFPSLAFFRSHVISFPLLQADGLRLPFVKECFDLCLCHFLLLWVKNPLQLLKEMNRVMCADGYGFILAEPDYGGRIDYPPSLEAAGSLQNKALRQRGADVMIGRKLKSLFRQAGFEVVESGVLGAQWLGCKELNDIDLEWEIFIDDVQELISVQEIQHLKEITRQAEENRERVLFIPTFYAVARKISA